MLTQRKPVEPFRKVAMDLQSFFSSSTMDTEIILYPYSTEPFKERTNSTVVPLPMRESTTQPPPNSAMRCRMLPSPLQKPAAEVGELDSLDIGSKPLPLSTMPILNSPS